MADSRTARRDIAPVLADWLVSDAAARRRIAAQALRNLDGLPPNAVPNLLKAARSDDARARADACQALAWVEPVPADIEPVIRKCINEVDPSSRHPAAAGLLVIKHDDQQAMRILIDTLVNSKHDPALVFEVRIALRQAGPEYLQFSGRWRKEEALWNEIHVLLQRREKEALPILMEWLKRQQPDVGLEEIEKHFDNGIANLRKQDPSFLMLSAEAEARVMAGDLRQDSIARLDTALKFLTEYEIKISGLSNALLEQYKTGELSNEATELLAHLLAAQVKQARKALGGE